ncbi:MAG: flagellar hook-length control protein FliK [Oligoflexia bacterium]|nr:flagellar hook-length control protein FliK [Oligoflexia bacterium]
MSQEIVSSVPFFPDLNSPGSKLDQSSRRTGKPSQEAVEFAKSLNQASERTSNSAVKVDKPKLGNREPFFPKTAMPYHPEPEETSKFYPTTEEVVEIKDVEAAKAAASLAQAEETGVVEQGDEMIVPTPSFFPVAGQVAQKDDQAGVLAKSYQSMAVSYPISRIAELDEETQKQLELQGLWNMPTTIAAQPSPQLQVMNQAVEQPMVVQGPVQKHVAQFMASMESELGVSRDRLARAFEQLPPGTLAQPPSETMAQVIDNLELSPKEEVKAQQLFGKMIDGLAKDELAPSQPMDPKLAFAASGGALAGQMRGQVDAPVSSQARVATQHYSKVAKLAPEAVETSRAPVGGIEGSQVSAPQPDVNAIQQPAELNNPFSQGSTDQGAKGEFGSSAEGFDRELVKDSIEVKAGSSGSHDAPSGLSHVKPHGPLLASAGGVAQATDQLAPLTPQAKQEAVQNILNQAQLMAQKGGGEMKMTLKPDHLGEIQLHVAVDGNQVEVKMATQNSHTKQLIESHASELRHGLASQNFSMEKLDVTVGDRNNGSFNQSRGDNLGAARDFSSQLQNQGQNRREQASAMSELRSTAPRGLARPEMVSTPLHRPTSMRGHGSLSVRA